MKSIPTNIRLKEYERRLFKIAAERDCRTFPSFVRAAILEKLKREQPDILDALFEFQDQIKA